MPEQFTAKFFTQHGVDAATATRFAAESNQSAGVQGTDAPLPVAAQPSGQPQGARLNPMHEAKVAASAAEFRRLDPSLTDATARSLALQEFQINSGSGIERPAIFNQLENQRIEEAFAASIDAGMQPATAPFQYNTGPSPTDEQSAAVDADLRQAMFQSGLSIEIGNRLAQTVTETAGALDGASTEKIESYMGEQERMLRSMWGSSYDAKLAATRDFLRKAGENSPALRALVDSRPEVFSSWQTVAALARVAEHQQRIGAGA
jgi:hypothetical protein